MDKMLRFLMLALGTLIATNQVAVAQIPDRAVITPLNGHAEFNTGVALELTCTLKPEYDIDVKTMYFTHSGMDGPLDIKEEWVVIVTNTSVKLSVPPEYVTVNAAGTYQCWKNSTGEWWPLAQRNANVYAALRLDAMNCVTSDLQTMTCDFCDYIDSLSEYSKPNFTFSYSITLLPDRSGTCDNSCRPEFSSANPDDCYFVMNVEYVMKVTVTNSAGPFSSIIPVRTDSSIVRADPVANLKAAATATNLTVSWDYPADLAPWPELIILEFTVNVTNLETNEVITQTIEGIDGTSVTITDLQPFTSYDVSVTSLPVGPADEGYRSNASVIQTATLMDAPEQGPVVPPGTFRLVPGNCPGRGESDWCAYVAWEEVVEMYRNGIVDSYHVWYERLWYERSDTWRSEVRVLNSSVHQFSFPVHASLHGNHQKDADVKVYVAAHTEGGLSSPAITRFSTTPAPGPGDIEADWVGPEVQLIWTLDDAEDTESIENLTLFMCDGDGSSINNLAICKGVPSHVIVEPQSSGYNVTADENTMFALSVNYKNGDSSGLSPSNSWICVFRDPTINDPPPPANMDLNQDDLSITVQWDPVTCERQIAVHAAPVRIRNHVITLIDVSSDENVTVDTATVHGDVTQHVFSDLEEGRTYRVSLVSESAFRRSDTTARDIKLRMPFEIWKIVLICIMLMVAMVITAVCTYRRCKKKGYLCFNNQPMPEPPPKCEKLDLETSEAYTSLQDDYDSPNYSQITTAIGHLAAADATVERQDSDRSSGYTSDLSDDKKQDDASSNGSGETQQTEARGNTALPSPIDDKGNCTSGGSSCFKLSAASDDRSQPTSGSSDGSALTDMASGTTISTSCTTSFDNSAATTMSSVPGSSMVGSSADEDDYCQKGGERNEALTFAVIPEGVPAAPGSWDSAASMSSRSSSAAESSSPPLTNSSSTSAGGGYPRAMSSASTHSTDFTHYSDDVVTSGGTSVDDVITSADEVLFSVAPTPAAAVVPAADDKYVEQTALPFDVTPLCAPSVAPSGQTFPLELLDLFGADPDTEEAADQDEEEHVDGAEISGVSDNNSDCDGYACTALHLEKPNCS